MWVIGLSTKCSLRRASIAFLDATDLILHDVHWFKYARARFGVVSVSVDLLNVNDTALFMVNHLIVGRIGQEIIASLRLNPSFYIFSSWRLLCSSLFFPCALRFPWRLRCRNGLRGWSCTIFRLFLFTFSDWRWSLNVVRNHFPCLKQVHCSFEYVSQYLKYIVWFIERVTVPETYIPVYNFHTSSNYMITSRPRRKSSAVRSMSNIPVQTSQNFRSI